MAWGGEADLQRWPAVADDSWYATERSNHNGARIQVFPLPSGKMIVPTFELPVSIPVSLGTVEGDWVAEGDTKRSFTLLPAGDYLLRAQADGFPVVERRFSIVAGQTTDVSVALDRSD